MSKLNKCEAIFEFQLSITNMLYKLLNSKVILIKNLNEKCKN